jgi:hypothetical protein
MRRILVLALLGSSSVVLANDDGAHWDAIKKCAVITNDRARHSCTDDVMRDAGLLAAPVAKSVEQPKALEQPKAVDRRKDFGLTPAPPPKPTPDEQRLEVTLASVEQGPDGKLILTTNDGAVWHQVESDAIRPMPAKGQTLKVSQTSFGGFLCEAAKRVAFRCFRSR